jgi:hypothetical protein
MLNALSRDSYPFSIFWKWHIRDDDFLAKEIPL